VFIVVGFDRLIDLNCIVLFLACNQSKPLGMESGAIKDSQINASSYYYHGPPRYARLRSNTSGWIPHGFPLKDEWIQVNLLSAKNITAVATQGNCFNPYLCIGKYSLSYSNDGARFTPYESNKVFTGNVFPFNSSTVRNELVPPIKAQFIRLIVKEYYIIPALRMELYGCD